MKKSFLVVIVFLMGAAVGKAGVLLSFDAITQNGDYADKLKLQVDITASDNYMTFSFLNKSDYASSISEIYIDDDWTMTFGGINNYYDDFCSREGTCFIWGACPCNLPGGRELEDKFIADPGLSIQSLCPSPKWGVNPGERVDLVCHINCCSSAADVLLGLASGDIRIGLHVQSLPDGSSESYINRPYDPLHPETPEVPEPATLVIFGAGSLVLARLRRIRPKA